MDGSAHSLDVEQLLQQRGWLRSLARGLVGEGNADDLVQEAWLVALNGRTRPGKSQTGWLAGIVRNLSRRRRWHRAEWAVMEADVASALVPATDELLARAELQEKLINAVRELHEPYRATVLLRYFEDLSVEELSARMGVPSSTGRTRLQRALSLLRVRLLPAAGEMNRGFLAALLAEADLPQVFPWEGWVMGTQAKVLVSTGLVIGVAVIAREVIQGHGDARPTTAFGAQAPPSGVPTSEPPPEPSRLPPADPGLPNNSPRISAPRESMLLPTAPSEDTSSSAREEIERIASSFLTDDPDARGLLRFFSDLPGSVAIDEASVTLDPAWNLVEGRLVLEHSDLSLSFSIHKDVYQVNFAGPGQSNTLLASDVTLVFTDDPDTESITLRVQYLPDTREAPNQFLHPSEEKYVGWTATVGATGAVLQPLSMRIDQNGAWVIGHSSAIRPRTEPWLWDTNTRRRWLLLLKPLAEARAR